MLHPESRADLDFKRFRADPPLAQSIMVLVLRAVLLGTGLLAMRVALLHAGHRTGTAPGYTGPGCNSALAGDDFVIEVGWQNADNRVESLHACEPVATHAAR